VYSINYLLEKFSKAVYDLATGERDARARVGKAYYRFWTIPLMDYPEPLRERRKEIKKLLTRLSQRGDSTIQDNLTRMKNKTASRIAALILEIYFELQKNASEIN